MLNLIFTSKMNTRMSWRAIKICQGKERYLKSIQLLSLTTATKKLFDKFVEGLIKNYLSFIGKVEFKP